jgi:hypothetical protein
MAMTAKERIERIVRSFRMGARCETEFCATLLDASKDITPEQLMELLPSDLRAVVTFGMLNPILNEGDSKSPDFVRLSEYLRLRSTSDNGTTAGKTSSPAY